MGSTTPHHRATGTAVIPSSARHRLARWGWTVPEVQALVPAALTAPQEQLRLVNFLTALDRWSGLVGEQPSSPIKDPAGVSPVLLRWALLGRDVFLPERRADRLRVCAPLWDSVLDHPGQPPMRQVLVEADGPVDLFAPFTAHLRHKVTAAHQRWWRVVPPNRFGALYLDLADAGMHVRQAEELVVERPAPAVPDPAADAEFAAQIRTVAALLTDR